MFVNIDDNVRIGVNSLEQSDLGLLFVKGEQPYPVPHCLSTFQQTKKAVNFVVIGALRVNKKNVFLNQFLRKQITCSPTLLAQTKFYSCVYDLASRYAILHTCVVCQRILYLYDCQRNGSLASQYVQSLYRRSDCPRYPKVVPGRSLTLLCKEINGGQSSNQTDSTKKRSMWDKFGK